MRHFQASQDCGTKEILLITLGSQRAEEPRELSPQALVTWCPAELDLRTAHVGSSLPPQLTMAVVGVLHIPICQKEKQSWKWLTLTPQVPYYFSYEALRKHKCDTNTKLFPGWASSSLRKPLPRPVPTPTSKSYGLQGDKPRV